MQIFNRKPDSYFLELLPAQKSLDQCIKLRHS
jgi:hypothetical protein